MIIRVLQHCGSFFEMVYEGQTYSLINGFSSFNLMKVLLSAPEILSESLTLEYWTGDDGRRGRRHVTAVYV